MLSANIYDNCLKFWLENIGKNKCQTSASTNKGIAALYLNMEQSCLLKKLYHTCNWTNSRDDSYNQAHEP